MNLNPLYILLRLIRRFLPEPVVRFLLRREVILRPGLETREPAEAAARYVQALQRHGFSLEGKRVLVFGYGGNFAIGAELVRAGARQVTLLDRFAPPDDRRNRLLPQAYPEYFTVRHGRVHPLDEHLVLVHDDLRRLKVVHPFDVVVSSSVYEHLDDPDGLTEALAARTAPDGVHVHYVDLRDHYFRLPFEMLKFSEAVWKRWLNPTSNLNRLRLRDYQRIFESYFSQVHIQVLARDREAFERARPFIRPEFLTGDDEHDSVTLIEIVAAQPQRRGESTEEGKPPRHEGTESQRESTEEGKPPRHEDTENQRERAWKRENHRDTKARRARERARRRENHRDTKARRARERA